ncbi:MAG: ATP-binding cassette domain-containing protein [Acidobacteria bacterium]|nr:ATP-binding cassette domain-containing protein [Acidobacteriota bacterium]
MLDPVIETIELTKQYGPTKAVDQLTLLVPRGSIYGFLGRNGAGKTTVIKILLGTTYPTSGEARVLGGAPNDPQEGVEIRRRVGFVSEEKQLHVGMTVEQIINLVSVACALAMFYLSIRLFVLNLPRFESRLLPILGVVSIIEGALGY